MQGQPHICATHFKTIADLVQQLSECSYTANSYSKQGSEHPLSPAQSIISAIVLAFLRSSVIGRQKARTICNKRKLASTASGVSAHVSRLQAFARSLNRACVKSARRSVVKLQHSVSHISDIHSHISSVLLYAVALASAIYTDKDLLLW